MLGRISIRTKMFGAFGAVLALLLGVGGIVLVQKQVIIKDAKVLAGQSVPMLDHANSVERHALASSSAIAGFVKTRNAAYFETAMSELTDVESSLQEASELATDQGMDALLRQVQAAQSHAAEYRQLAEEVRSINAEMDAIQAAMDDAGATFMETAKNLVHYKRDIIEGRDIAATARAEIERVEKQLKRAEDIRRDGDEAKLANFRSQLEQNPAGLLEAAPFFEDIEKKLDAMLENTKSDAVVQKIASVRGASASYWTSMQEMNGAWTRRDAVAKGLQDAAGTVVAEARGATEQGIDEAAAMAALTKEHLGTAMTVVVGGIAGVGVLSIVIAFVMTGAIVKPITHVVDRVQTLADRNLSDEPLKTSSRDETGKLTVAVNTLHESLREVVTSVTRGAEEVASASGQIAGATQEISAGMEHQTREVDQVSAAIEEMSASVREVATESGEASGEATESGRSAEEGGRVVAETIDGMNLINEAVAAGSASVASLGERGEQIGEVIGVINDIADQTNLLALNAAIEAARAGEHGRGFAVVADEVRKLADRTTKATEEISSSIVAIQTETQEAVDRMNAGTEHVRAGVEKANASGERLSAIVDSSGTVARKIEAIAAAAEEQSAASEEVARSVERIAHVSREASDSARDGAAAAEQLSSRARNLSELVGQFKL